MKVSEIQIKDIIQKYEALIKGTINPDNLDWEDLGFDEPMEGYLSIEDYIENENCELDEGQQTSIRCYREIIQDLKILIGEEE